jgi:uncharacterized lipoprotein YmbA
MRRGDQARQAVLVAALALVLFGVAACGRTGPPPDRYVLGEMPSATSKTLPETGLPVVEVGHVRVPDYLDTTEIMERSGNRLVSSATGRWGERLSVGMTRAVAAALAARLPRAVVTAERPTGRVSHRVLIDVAAFEPRSDHQVVLVAQWTVADETNSAKSSTVQSSEVETMPTAGDGDVAAAMTRAIERLADQIAVAVKR